jgi:pimeloyl-ACP methyl ester carboxylesterase
MKLTIFMGMQEIMDKKFITLSSTTLFYRQQGHGPLLLLLHPSPRNGKMMEPLMQLLSVHFTVVVPDLPGYGFSTPLPQPVTSMYDYAGALHEWLQGLTKDPIFIYGTATGAQAGIAYALTHPQQVRHLFLDNCAHFSEVDCEEILQRYFIDISPQPNGSHLSLLWQHVCDSCLYFPWYEKNEAHRIADVLPPLTVIQNIVTDYLLAGPNYADAYKTAFKHERAAYVQQLKAPATIFKWLGSPLLPHMNDLLEHTLPDNIRVVETAKEMEGRYRRMVEEMVTNGN